MFKRYARRCAAAILATCIVAGANAGIVDFNRITSNSAYDVGSQLQVSVSPVSSNRVEFRLVNAGPLASSMTAWYFQGVSALFQSIYAIDNSSAGVTFTADGAPPNLPGGAPYDFTPDFRVTSTAPRSPNGVNPGEYLAVIFNLKTGVALSDVLDRIAAGTLRLGMHIQSLPDGDSDSYLSCPPTNAVPSPTALSAGMLGMACAGMLRRRLG
jgi:hypothetical protein